MFAIKFVHRSKIEQGVDESDLDWQPIAGHGDYGTPDEANAACDEYDAAFDHEYVHRAFPVANDTEQS